MGERFKNLDRLAEVSEDALLEIREIGPTTAKSVVDFFKQPATHKIIEKLKNAGVRFNIVEVKKEATAFSGKTFVITGTLKNYSRSDAEQLIRRLGGYATSSVSKKTDFLVAGEEPGSKYDKAKELGVKILKDDEFKRMIDRAK